MRCGSTISALVIRSNDTVTVAAAEILLSVYVLVLPLTTVLLSLHSLTRLPLLGVAVKTTLLPCSTDSPDAMLTPSTLAASVPKLPDTLNVTICLNIGVTVVVASAPLPAAFTARTLKVYSRSLKTSFQAAH